MIVTLAFVCYPLLVFTFQLVETTFKLTNSCTKGLKMLVSELEPPLSPPLAVLVSICYLIPYFELIGRESNRSGKTTISFISSLPYYG